MAPTETHTWLKGETEDTPHRHPPFIPRKRVPIHRVSIVSDVASALQRIPHFKREVFTGTVSDFCLWSWLLKGAPHRAPQTEEQGGDLSKKEDKADKVLAVVERE